MSTEKEYKVPDQLNKAFNQANMGLANRAGFTDIKTQAIDIGSDFERQAAEDRKREMASLLDRAKLLKKEELSPYQQAMLGLQKQKMERSQEYLDEQRNREKRIANQQQINTMRGFLKDDPTYKKTSEQMVEFDQVGDIIDQAQSGNQAAVAALGTKLARAMGEVGVLTDTDVVRYVQGTSWGRKLQDWAKRGFEGELSEDTINDMLDNIDTIQDKLNNNKEKIFKRAASRTQAAYPDVPEETIYGVLGYQPQENLDQQPIKDERQSDTVLMQSPDGQTARVRKDQVQKYLDKGAKIVE